MSVKIKEKFFGKLKDGSQVFQYTLSNRNGMTVKVKLYSLDILAQMILYLIIVH